MKIAEDKKVFLKSLIETNKLTSNVYREFHPDLQDTHEKQTKDKRGKNTKIKATYSIHSYAHSDITLFRKPILDYMYETWPFEFNKASNDKQIIRKGFDISFGYVNVLLEEEVGVGIRRSTNEMKKDCKWSSRGEKNAGCVSVITDLEKGDYFNLIVGNDLSVKSKETLRLKKMLCKLYPEKSSFEKLDSLNPCDKFK